MYEESIKLLKKKNIKFEDGLTSDELENVEKIYKIKIPNSLRMFLMAALPISNGFYNWRNTEENNINFIKSVIEKPQLDIFNMAEEIYWCDDWGEEPNDEEIIVNEVRKRLYKAPKLIPIYAHRYMPMISESNPPIISVHDVDVIYYGESLQDYFNVEFGSKKQDEICFQNIKPILFWTDIM